MKLTVEQKETLKELCEIFNIEQIEEILKGVKEGSINVDIYTNTDWGYWKMYQVRKILEENPNIEFSDFNFNLFSAEELQEMKEYFNNLDSNLLFLKEQAKFTERKNEMLKIIQRFVDRDFKEEKTMELNKAILENSNNEAEKSILNLSETEKS